MGEPASAKPAPAAVRKNSRRVGLVALSAELPSFVALDFGIFGPEWCFISCGSLGYKLVARIYRDQGRGPWLPSSNPGRVPLLRVRTNCWGREAAPAS